MLSNSKEVSRENLLNEVAGMVPNGYRFVTVTCLDEGDSHEIIYHFDKDYELLNLRVKLPRGQRLPSISNVFFAAVLVENELKDMFGIELDNLVLDFQGRLVLAEQAPQAPLNKKVIAVADATKPVGSGGQD